MLRKGVWVKFEASKTPRKTNSASGGEESAWTDGRVKKNCRRVFHSPGRDRFCQPGRGPELTFLTKYFALWPGAWYFLIGPLLHSLRGDTKHCSVSMLTWSLW